MPAAYLKVLLPVGISFYTFQSMCYTIDVFQKKLEPVKNFLHFATFTVFFPSLVAGPITKAQQLIPQLQARPRLTAELVGNGTFLIVKGLVKKIVFADFLALNLVDRVFDNPQAFTSVETLIGLYGYTLQIYCDFSGYTDVARGSAMLLGIELPENFNRPYMATKSRAVLATLAHDPEFVAAQLRLLPSWRFTLFNRPDILEPLADTLPHRHLAWGRLDVRGLRNHSWQCHGRPPLLL